MKLADRITAVLLLILSGFWIYWARQLPYPKFAQVSKMGPGDFPTIVAALLAIFAVWLFVETFRYPSDQKDTDGGDKSKIIRNPKAVRDILTGFGLFTAMLLLVPFLGFSLSSAGFVFLFLIFIGRYKLWLSILIAILIPFVLWFIFAYLLTVPLPKGPWGF
jgi:putative tricarboxylic transport membrane protein